MTMQLNISSYFLIFFFIGHSGLHILHSDDSLCLEKTVEEVKKARNRFKHYI